ncbi:MAG: methyltransferase domain-containing protein [Planctomycetota bacterium]
MIADETAARRTLRILEISAGTGGNDGRLRLALRDRLLRILVRLDLTPTFLHKAEERFAGDTFLRYCLLDIEQLSGELDGVLIRGRRRGGERIHATRNIFEFLRNARRLLRPGGFLLLIETTTAKRFADLTFGLAAGMVAV